MRVFVIVGTGIAAVALFTTPAVACRCDMRAVKDLALQVDLLATAEVVSAPSQDGGLWSVRVVGVLRGDPAAAGTVIALNPGPGSCAAVFPAGKPFPLAAKRDAPMSYSTNDCLSIGAAAAVKQ